MLSWRRSLFTKSHATLLPVGLVLLLSSVACSTEPNSGNGDGPDDPIQEPPDESTIRFTPSDDLSLLPSETTTLAVEVLPVRRQNVTFEILTDSDFFDGFLLQSESRVRDDGTALIELRAPSRPARFRVRASLPDGPVAVRSVSVGTQGFATIDVAPSYDGVRDIRQWTASAHVGATCDELSSYFDDGQLLATGASRATITNVPSGVPIALTLRGGALASGCATLAALRADDTKEVDVQVTDRPVDVQTGTLEVTLGVTSSTTNFARHLEAAILLGSGVVHAPEESEAMALLRRIGDSLTATERLEFEGSITAFDLETLVDDLYVQGSPVAQKVANLLTSASSHIIGDKVFRGNLQLKGPASQFQLTEVVGVDAQSSGFFQGSTWVVSSEAPDTVVLGGTLSYSPLRWLLGIANSEAMGGPSPGEQLASSAKCDEVGNAIFSAASGPPFGACDGACIADLCRASTSSLWATLAEAGEEVTSLQVGMSGTARLFGAAYVDSFTGSWVGRLGSEDETSIGGDASGSLVIAEE